MSKTLHNIARWTAEHQAEFLDNIYLELGDTYTMQTDNPIKLMTDKHLVPEEIVRLCSHEAYLSFGVKHILNMNLFPYQMVILSMLWTKRLPILLGARGCAKTTLLAVYLALRALLDQGIKIIVTGAGLRQSGVVFSALEQIWENAPVLRDICGGNEDNRPKRTILGYEWKVGKSIITGIPVGTGDKIRGLRANIIAADEMASINPEIFETVIRGFAVVQSQDTFNVVKHEYQKRLLTELDLDVDAFLNAENEHILLGLTGNQIILSGTANYQFNHFFKYYEDYNKIILNEGKLDHNHHIKNWQEYAVIRIPFHKLPPGLMDETILEQGQAVMDTIIYQMEYCCVWPKDSAGFYPASTIHASTCPLKEGDDEIRFVPELHGESTSQYIMGIDPASEQDNLTISICKLCDNYRAHVYTWSANRRRFEEDMRKNKSVYIGIGDYNTFIIRKIHDLSSRFNLVRIHIDSGGGGHSIIEGLKDRSKLEDGQSCIYDMEDLLVGAEKGLHIIQLCQFTKRDWYEGAHYNLLKDLTSRNYLFPEYDSVAIEQYRVITDNNPFGNLVYDTLEGISSEIEITKYQTTLIEETTTPKGLKKWDLPKLAGVLTADIASKVKKDHFTSLLLVNDAARAYIEEQGMSTTSVRGYAAHEIVTKTIAPASQMYCGRGIGALRNQGHKKFDFNNFAQKDLGGTVVY